MALLFITFLTHVLVAQMVKNLPAMQETQVLSLGWEDPLEKGMAAVSSVLTGQFPWTEEPGRLHVVHGVAKSRTRLSDFTSLHAPRQASLVAQTVKNLPAMQETWVRSLGWEDSLEKGVATHSSILAWRVPWTEEPGRLQSMGSQRVGHN